MKFNANNSNKNSAITLLSMELEIGRWERQGGWTFHTESAREIMKRKDEIE